MDSKLKFKIVVEQDNKEVASAVLGHEILAEIASRQVNWREEAIYADLHQYLINFPHPTVWQNVAGVTRNPDIFAEVLKKRDVRTLSRLVENEHFTKQATPAQLVELAKMDSGIAYEIARARQNIAQNDEVDIKVINELLESLNNYEVDQVLAGDNTYRKQVVKMAKHVDPFIAAEARGNLD